MEKRVINICDVCEEIFAGGDAPKDRFSETKTDDFSVPIYSNGEANSGLYGYTNFSRVNVPSITVSARGTIGYTTIRHEPFVPIVRLITLVPKTDVIDINYLYYATQNYKFVNNGTSIPQLTVPMLKRYSFPLPSMEQQKKIADEFDKVTVLIDKRKRQLEKLDELVKSRFVELFGDPEKNTFSWKEEELSKHLTVIGGYAFKSEQFSEEGIPVLRIGNINAGFFKPVNLVYWEDDDALNRYKMYPGDLVMSLTGTVGKDDYGNVCILGNDYDVYYLNQRNAKLELQDTINKYYLSMLLKFEPVKKKLTGISRGVRQANISNKDILNLPVPIPPIELQNQFADFVTQVDKSKFEIKQSLEMLELLKKALMQKYFG